MRRLLVPLGLLLCAAGAASAFPDGAPWGSADPEAAENCATCHFSEDPVTDSSALEVRGWPDEIAAGATYELVLRFTVANAGVAGAQLFVRSAGEEAGSFRTPAPAMETAGAAARTTAPQPVENAVASWRLTWQAPLKARAPVELCVGASAANADASPFGDTIHFRCFEAAPAPMEALR